MKQSPILLEAHRTFSKLLSILEAKGKDYATDSDIYQNFRLAEKLLQVPVKKGIATRILEKVSRICNLLDKDAEVKSETIDDTLDDLIGLAIILKAKLREERERTGEVNGSSDEPEEVKVRVFRGTIEEFFKIMNSEPKPSYDDPIWAGENTGTTD